MLEETVGKLQKNTHNLHECENYATFSNNYRFPPRSEAPQLEPRLEIQQQVEAAERLLIGQ